MVDASLADTDLCLQAASITGISLKESVSCILTPLDKVLKN